MSEIESAGPAFPTDEENKVSGVHHYEGLTKREWFAAMALQGIMASGDAHGNELGIIAQEAYAIADSMIRAGKGENR